MKLINYHIHTPLCGHASGEIEDYVRSAISSDLKEIGFSDHAPIPLPYREGITMHPNEVEFYINEVLNLKEKYKSKIQIKLGFEVDFPLFDTFEKKYFNDSRIDYLIGSCHFLNDWAFDHPDFIDEYEKNDIDKIYENYYREIYQLVKTGLFNIIGHFDLIKKFGHRANQNFHDIIEKICSSVTANKNMAIEINTSGLLKPVKEIYPAEDIIKIFYDMNVPVTLGADVHSPELISYELKNIIDLLKKIGYKKISGFSKRKRYDINL